MIEHDLITVQRHIQNILRSKGLHNLPIDIRYMPANDHETVTGVYYIPVNYKVAKNLNSELQDFLILQDYQNLFLTITSEVINES